MIKTLKKSSRTFVIFQGRTSRAKISLGLAISTKTTSMAWMPLAKTRDSRAAAMTGSTARGTATVAMKTSVMRAPMMRMKAKSALA